MKEFKEEAASESLGGRKLRDGSILAPVMGFEAAPAKYTADI